MLFWIVLLSIGLPLCALLLREQVWRWKVNQRVRSLRR